MSWLSKVRTWLRRAPSARKLTRVARRYQPSVESLERRELLSGSTFHLDLGTARSPVAEGYTQVPLVSL